MNDFDNLSLEYKLSNIGKTKFFAAVLDQIGCFYTDRPVAYEMVTSFTSEELIHLGVLEHKRWEKEKQVMCWLPGGNMGSSLKANDNQLRELSRMHYDLGVKFDDLSIEAQSKDYSHLNTLIEKLLEFDGIRVYRYH